MPKYIVYSSEIVLYQTEVEGANEAEALLRFSLEEIGDEVERVGYQTDDVKEVVDDESI